MDTQRLLPTSPPAGGRAGGPMCPPAGSPGKTGSRGPGDAAPHPHGPRFPCASRSPRPHDCQSDRRPRRRGPSRTLRSAPLRAPGAAPHASPRRPRSSSVARAGPEPGPDAPGRCEPAPWLTDWPTAATRDGQPWAPSSPAPRCRPLPEPGVRFRVSQLSLLPSPSSASERGAAAWSSQGGPTAAGSITSRGRPFRASPPPPPALVLGPGRCWPRCWPRCCQPLSLVPVSPRPQTSLTQSRYHGHKEPLGTGAGDAGAVFSC